MISVNDIYLTVKSLANKEGGSFTANEFNRYAAMVSIDLFNLYWGSVKQYGQRALPRVAYGKTQTISENLKHLMVVDSPIALTSGKGTLPDGLVRMDYVSCDTGEIKRVENHQWVGYKSSVVFTPSLTNPIYREIGNEIDVLPSNVVNPKITYLRYPATPKWAYTINSSKPTYDPDSSTDFDWPETERNEIITRLLGYLGIQNKDQQLTNNAQSKQQTIS